MSNCDICKRELDDLCDPTTANCGGTCLQCMALIGNDPDCLDSLTRALLSEREVLQARLKGRTRPERKRMAAKFEWLDVDTLTVTHIFEGEEVVRGGEDGQAWVATFASRGEADGFVGYLKSCRAEIEGIRT